MRLRETIIQNTDNMMAQHNDVEQHMELLRKFPKVELHAHLNGSIRETTLFELANERNVRLSQNHFSEDTRVASSDHSIYNVRPRSLQDCFAVFAEIGTVVDDLPAIRRITLETLQDFANEGCAYLELRSTPKRLLVEHGKSTLATKRDYCETILQVMKEFQANEEEQYSKEVEKNKHAVSRLPLVACLIVSVDRSNDVPSGWENINLAIQLKKEYPDFVVGVDLGGNPFKRNFTDFAECFQSARQNGLFVTLHCAEVSCNDDDRNSRAYQDAQAILNFAPDRLGHALLLPPSLQAMLDNLRIPVETCPTSNVMTLELAKKSSGRSLVEGLKRHPQLKRWLMETKHPLAVSTDDPGVFNTKPTNELVLLQKAYNLSVQDLQAIILRSIDLAFVHGDRKNMLKERMKARFAAILTTET